MPRKGCCSIVSPVFRAALCSRDIDRKVNDFDRVYVETPASRRDRGRNFLSAGRAHIASSLETQTHCLYTPHHHPCPYPRAPLFPFSPKPVLLAGWKACVRVEQYDVL
jgi:hypothetical protein